MTVTAAPKTQANTLMHVQALRALAAMLVVITHALHEVAELFAARGLAFDEKIFPGDFGVDVFFVISGFIMVYVSRRQFGRRGHAWRFLKRRLIRIVPLYWLMTSAVAAIVLVAPSLMDNASREPLHWLGSYLFIPVARPGDGLIRPVLGLGWTLQYEMFFYLLFALVLALPLKRAVACLVIAIAAIVFAGLAMRPEMTVPRFLADPIMLEFAAGALLGLAWLRGVRMPAVLFWPATYGALLLLAVAPAFTAEMEIWRVTFYGLPALLLVGAAVISRDVENRPVHPLAVALGASSYALYLVHPFVLGLLKVGWARLEMTGLFGVAATPWLFAGGAIVVCAAAGHLLHLVFEKPATAWLNRHLDGSGSRQPGSHFAIFGGKPL